MLEALIEKKMIEDKRSLSSLDQSSFVNLIPKRLKTDVALSPKDKKEKVSERISALQQLVSPYGKTDTASVLFEAMEYIKFLHEQVKVLSAPYLYTTPTTQPLEMETCNGLKGRGLCVIPSSLIDGVASSNGADIWAPIKTSLNSRRSVSDESSVIT
ncbi:transcription factor bHLH153-like isoform X1 [Primulina tabacum]|uniref:transcription factor bHLH153-like isoform X1 n=2 Tax=Primulina tabacum TaxID=48773 RepID=UPI003F5A5598